MKVIRETELLSSIVSSLEINSNETIVAWLGTVNLKPCLLFSFPTIHPTFNLLFRLCWNDKIYPTCYDFPHLEYKCIFIWSFKLISILLFLHRYATTCTAIGIWESLDEAISIWMEVSFGQSWCLPERS